MKSIKAKSYTYIRGKTRPGQAPGSTGSGSRKKRDTSKKNVVKVDVTQPSKNPFTAGMSDWCFVTDFDAALCGIRIRPKLFQYVTVI